jgi:carboxypeptidase-like protein
MKTIAKLFVPLVSILSLINVRAQNKITGKLIDAKGNAVVFANIGIINKAVGTVSNEQGVFTLSFSNDLLADTMAITCLGYKNQKLLVKSFIETLSANGGNVLMENEVMQLQEVQVKGDKPHKIGSFNTNWRIRGFMASKAHGAELASTIYQEKEKTAHLVSFQFNIIRNDFDSLRFRINVYSVKNGMPDSNLMKGNEIFLLLKQHDEFKYKFKNDVYVTGSFIVSLELLDVFGQGSSKKLFEFSSEYGTKYFRRFTSQDKWETVKGFSLGYGLVVD